MSDEEIILELRNIRSALSAINYSVRIAKDSDLEKHYQPALNKGLTALNKLEIRFSVTYPEVLQF